MTTAIIGNGRMAAGLARRLAERSRPLVLGARDPERGRALARTLGPRIRATTVVEAARTADVIVLAVPYIAAFDTLAALGNVSGKVLVDVTNPITPDYMNLTLGFTTSAAEEIQKRVPDACVAKAFNTIFADLFAKPAAATAQVPVFYAADREQARDAAAELIAAAGFKPTYAGPLANARYLEPLAELNIHFGFALGLGTNIAPAWVTV